MIKRTRKIKSSYIGFVNDRSTVCEGGELRGAAGVTGRGFGWGKLVEASLATEKRIYLDEYLNK